MNAPVPTHVLPPLALRPVPEAMGAALSAQFGARFSTAAAVCEQPSKR